MYIILGIAVILLPISLNYVLQLSCLGTDIIGTPETWLSFWGTYMGAVGSLVMAIIAYESLRANSSQLRTEHAHAQLQRLVDAKAEFNLAFNLKERFQAYEEIECGKYSDGIVNAKYSQGRANCAGDRLRVSISDKKQAELFKEKCSPFINLKNNEMICLANLGNLLQDLRSSASQTVTCEELVSIYVKERIDIRNPVGMALVGILEKHNMGDKELFMENAPVFIDVIKTAASDSAKAQDCMKALDSIIDSQRQKVLKQV